MISKTAVNWTIAAFITDQCYKQNAACLWIVQVLLSNPVCAIGFLLVVGLPCPDLSLTSKYLIVCIIIPALSLLLQQ